MKTLLHNTRHSSFDFIECLKEKVTMLHPLNSNSSIEVDLTDLESASDESGLQQYIGTRTDLLSDLSDDQVMPHTSTSTTATDDSATERFSGGDSLVDRVSSTYDCQVLVETTHVYKATILKEIFSNEKVSGDRLRRVQGLSQYPDVNIRELEASLMPGKYNLSNKRVKIKIIALNNENDWNDDYLQQGS